MPAYAKISIRAEGNCTWREKPRRSEFSAARSGRGRNARFTSRVVGQRGRVTVHFKSREGLVFRASNCTMVGRRT
eukprot:6933579-Prymnesium_polylepis.2